VSPIIAGPQGRYAPSFLAPLRRDKEAVMRKCKEYKCNGKVPKVKKGALTTQRQIEALVCSVLGYCRYCYRMKVAPERQNTDEPVKQDRHLTPYEREICERRQFEGMEALLWSPDFYKEWKNYLKDKWGR